MESVEAIVACGRTLIEESLTWGHSGNISVRIEPGVFLITAGGTDLGKLDKWSIIRCRVDDGSWDGPRKPSMETELHRGIYQACPQANAVIHSQPPYSTLAACTDLAIRTDFLPEAMAYLGKIERVPYFHAGSMELAQATARQARNSNVLILENHGIVCWERTLDQALLLTRTLEFCCELIITAGSSGLDLHYLGEDTMEDFHRHLRSIGR